jgi:hypothetical protein
MKYIYFNIGQWAGGCQFIVLMNHRVESTLMYGSVFLGMKTSVNGSVKLGMKPSVKGSVNLGMKMSVKCDAVAGGLRACLSHGGSINGTSLVSVLWVSITIWVCTTLSIEEPEPRAAQEPTAVVPFLIQYNGPL